MALAQNKAKSFVLIMVIIALSAILLRVVIGKIIEITSSQNEAIAQSTLKSIATALDNYARNNQGVYPKALSVLSQSTPAYLDKDYAAEPSIKGYSYSCTRLDSSGYSCYAFPTQCKLTGKLAFTVTTGNLLISEDCNKKE
jgi:type II secretory pathway pseudopilin PulG